jgi:hypothetical protein
MPLTCKTAMVIYVTLSKPIGESMSTNIELRELR